MFTCFLCLITAFIYQAVFATLFWKLNVHNGYNTLIPAILCVLGVVSYILTSRCLRTIESEAFKIYALIAQSCYGLLCLLEINWILHRNFDENIKKIFPSPMEENINLLLIISCIINIAKSIFVRIVEPRITNRNSCRGFTKWQEDILKLENYFHIAKYGTELNGFESIIGHMKANMGGGNSRELFTILSDIKNDKCNRDSLMNDRCNRDNLMNDMPGITSDLYSGNRMSIATDNKDVGNTESVFNEESKSMDLTTEANKCHGLETLDSTSNTSEAYDDQHSNIRITEYSTVNNHKRISEAEISKTSLLKIFDEENATGCLRILTQGFESSLDFTAFHENFRQINAERKSLINSIEGSEYSIKILRNCSTAFEFILIFGIFIKIFEISNIFQFFVIPVLLFLFPTCIDLFDPFLFIIYTHPYDIGDRIFINTGKGDDNLIVKSIGLTSTVFERWNNEIVIISNKSLKDQVIKNIRRSKSQSWKIDITIPRKCLPKFKILKRHISDFVKQDSAFEGFELAINDIFENSFLSTSFIITHSINHQNGFFMWCAQNRFMKRLLKELRRLRIEYLPIDVNLIVEKSEF